LFRGAFLSGAVLTLPLLDKGSERGAGCARHLVKSRSPKAVAKSCGGHIKSIYTSRNYK